MDKLNIYSLNFRLCGLALGVPLALNEFAILEMIGTIARKSIDQLIGNIHHPDVAIYQAINYR